MTFKIRPLGPEDQDLLEPLLDRTFGPDRLAKTVYRLRGGVPDLQALAFVAVDADDQVHASIRYWPVLIEGAPAILLGPLAVEPALQGRGMGRALIAHSLAEARRLGHGVCLVVGEADYYGPFGFVNAAAAGIMLPGPVDLERFQVLELKPGALQGLRGLVGHAPEAETGGRPSRNGTAA